MKKVFNVALLACVPLFSSIEDMCEDVWEPSPREKITNLLYDIYEDWNSGNIKEVNTNIGVLLLLVNGAKDEID